jgi:hypothetical protein
MSTGSGEKQDAELDRVDDTFVMMIMADLSRTRMRSLRDGCVLMFLLAAVFLLSSAPRILYTLVWEMDILHEKPWMVSSIVYGVLPGSVCFIAGVFMSAVRLKRLYDEEMERRQKALRRAPRNKEP